MDNDLKTELFAPGEIVSQDSAYLATSDTVTSIESTAGYVINNSLRFNGTDAYLDRTPTVSGNRKTFTLSWWTKPTSDQTNQRIFGIGGQGNLQFSMMWGGNGILSLFAETTGTNVGFDTYRRKDSSDWMHCVLAFDTTQSIQSERMKLYIDGDAFPNMLKPIVLKAIEKRAIETLVFANKKINIGKSNNITYIIVELGADEADNKIVDEVKKGDLVITADIPLADRVIKKEAHAIDHRGIAYTDDNIKEYLAYRNLMEELRSAGEITKGPAPFNQKDVQKFANSFNAYLQNYKL